MTTTLSLQSRFSQVRKKKVTEQRQGINIHHPSYVMLLIRKYIHATYMRETAERTQQKLTSTTFRRVKQERPDKYCVHHLRHYLQQLIFPYFLFRSFHINLSYSIKTRRAEKIKGEQQKNKDSSKKG